MQANCYIAYSIQCVKHGSICDGNQSSRMMQAWWSELVTDGGAPPGRFAHAAVGAGETMYMVGGYAQGIG